jgi:hypothetical protein
MTIDEAILVVLKGNPAVAALVSTRITPLKLPERPILPAIVFELVGAQRDHHSTGPSGLVSLRVNLDLWGKIFDDVCRLSEAVRLCLDGYAGIVTLTLPTGGTSTLDIDSAFYVDSDDGWDDEVQAFWRRMYFDVMHNEATS